MIRIERLIGETTEVVLVAGPGPVAIAHWGAPLGEAADLDAILAVNDPGSMPAGSNWRSALPIITEHASGFDGRPGLVGSRPDGRDFAARFVTTAVERHGDSVTVTAIDAHARLELVTEIALDDALWVRCTLTNLGDDGYRLDELSISLPVPERADELITLGGRWTAEFALARHQWTTATLSAANRRGRTSHESVPLVFATESGAGEWSGEVWGAHLAWSGNHHWFAERTTDGRRHLQVGELLHAGEVVLGPGEQYRTPEVIAVHASNGLTPATWGLHRRLRARDQHPTSPRPVTFNSWEATYFDHDFDRLVRLATLAAAVGVERFVLDDGWFGSRRDDTSGLGDWWVSPDAHPNGLTPLIEAVHSAGMQFGIWVEPEMVNPDSELFRDHRDWVLTDDRYEPILHRHQLVVDLTNDDAFDHIHTALDRLLSDHAIDFVKWDMNRPHIHAADHRLAAGTHRQTLALYRLLDRLRADHPSVEIESCASGGGRIDHAILQRTDRVWTSDSNDALERQRIQYGASMLIPPELMGAHIGPRRAHTTGRVHDIGFRAITALFGHFGIEADLTEFDDRELDVVRATIELYRRYRDLLHSGDTVRFDLEAPWLAHGVYATDRSRALISVAALDATPTAATAPLRLIGLDDEHHYRITPIPLPRVSVVANIDPPAWWSAGELTATGRQLAAHGLRLPALLPASAILIGLEAIETP